jgi:hypothetical protein
MVNAWELGEYRTLSTSFSTRARPTMSFREYPGVDAFRRVPTRKELQERLEEQSADMDRVIGEAQLLKLAIEDTLRKLRCGGQGDDTHGTASSETVPLEVGSGHATFRRL